jgi:hypothetical protein
MIDVMKRHAQPPCVTLRRSPNNLFTQCFGSAVKATVVLAKGKIRRIFLLKTGTIGMAAIENAAGRDMSLTRF